MNALRAIFLAGMILALAGSAFADKGGIPNSNSNGKGKGADLAVAPEIDLSGSWKYEVLLIGGGAILLLERRRRRRRVSQEK